MQTEAKKTDIIVIHKQELQEIVENALQKRLAGIEKMLKLVEQTPMTVEEARKELRISRRTFFYYEDAGYIKRMNKVGRPRYSYKDVLELKSTLSN
jgi:ACT domain-containing protein